MTIGMLFWVLMILWLVFGGWQTWGTWHLFGGNILLWVLLALLGWKTFGPMIHG